MISYHTGDATSPDHGIIAHVCNDAGGWGAGFVLAISSRWPQPEAIYRHHAAKGNLRLGTIHLVPVTPALLVANMIAQHGYATPEHRTPLRYDALASCLATLAALAATSNPGAVFHMPRIGTGLAGGNWDEIEPIISHQLRNYDVRIYDLPENK